MNKIILSLKTRRRRILLNIYLFNNFIIIKLYITNNLNLKLKLKLKYILYLLIFNNYY